MTRIQTKTDTVLGRTREEKFVTTKRRVTTASSSSSSSSSTGSKGFTRDDIVESFESSKASSALHNDDLSPVLKQNRTFSTFDTASLWVGLVVCVPAWQLVSSLMGIGNLSAFLALLLVFVANLFVVWPIVLQANAGVKYGIPFVVHARSSFGVKGANVAGLSRGFIASCVVRDSDGGGRELFEKFSGRFRGGIGCIVAVFGRHMLYHILALASVRGLERRGEHKDDREARGADFAVFDASLVYIYVRFFRRCRAIGSLCVCDE